MSCELQAQGIEAEIPKRILARDCSAEPDPGGITPRGCALQHFEIVLLVLSVPKLQFKLFNVKKSFLMMLCRLLLL
jgi:hypothetical protein